MEKYLNINKVHLLLRYFELKIGHKPIELEREDNKEEKQRHHNNGSSKSGTSVKRIEFNEANKSDLDKEQKNANHSRANPRNVNIGPKSLAVPLVVPSVVLAIVDRLNLGQDTRANHERQNVDADEQTRDARVDH